MIDLPDTPHQRLEWARRRAGFESAAEFAKAVGIHATTYRAYENGQNGYAKLAPTFAKKLGVNVDMLLTGENADGMKAVQPAPIANIEPDIPAIRGASDQDGAVTIRAVDLSYAMGDGSNLEDYPDVEGMQFDPNFIRTLTRAPANRLFVARGDGDSMFPTLVNDDQVLIDTTQRTLNLQDRIWACSLYGAGMIKRLRVIGEGKIEVRSDNPTVGNREADLQDVNIVGRVIWVGRRL